MQGAWRFQRSNRVVYTRGSENTQAGYICRPRYVYNDLMTARKYPLGSLFKALADRTRLRILNLIVDRELCVCYFTQVLNTSQPKISRHLAYLRRMGIVGVRR